MILQNFSETEFNDIMSALPDELPHIPFASPERPTANILNADCLGILRRNVFDRLQRVSFSAWARTQRRFREWLETTNRRVTIQISSHNNIINDLGPFVQQMDDDELRSRKIILVSLSGVGSDVGGVM